MKFNENIRKDLSILNAEILPLIYKIQNNETYGIYISFAWHARGHRFDPDILHLKGSGSFRNLFSFPIHHKFFSMKGVYTVLLLILSNTFMTLAWYGHLKFREWKWFETLPLVAIVLISWGIALFEYFFQVPANRIGFNENGGPFTLVELKVIQEVITLVVFTIFSLLFFRNETFRLNHLIGFVFLILAVYFIFKK
jgi:uncharacterized protein